MKIRHIENVRLVMLASYIAARVFVSNDDTVFSEVNNFLLSNGISMEDITIGKNITTVEKDTFVKCKNLKRVLIDSYEIYRRLFISFSKK